MISPAEPVDSGLLHKLLKDVFAVIVHTIAASIQQIYRWAVPIALLPVVLSFLLPEIKLRASLHLIAGEIPMSNTEPQP